jgi:hypothetical protein
MNEIFEREIKNYKRVNFEIISRKDNEVLLGRKSFGSQIIVRLEHDLTKDYPEYTWISSSEAAQNYDFSDFHSLFFQIGEEELLIQVGVEVNSNSLLAFDFGFEHLTRNYKYVHEGLDFVNKHKSFIKDVYGWFKETLLSLKNYRIYSITNQISIKNSFLLDSLYK